MALIGYARVSTLAQDEALQRDALEAAGCATERVYVDKVTGASTSRPQLDGALDYLRDHQGDTLVVWRLDRARSEPSPLGAGRDGAGRAGASVSSP